jgi:hypothetical protein
VGTITIEEENKGERVRFVLTVVRCKQCGQVHGGNTINYKLVPNFALSHFSNHTTNPSCKKSDTNKACVAKYLSFSQQSAGPMGLYVVDAKR